NEEWLRSASERRAMEMHVLPFAILLVPDARFQEGRRDGSALGAQPLIEANICNHRRIAHDVDARRTHRCQMCPFDAAEVEIELVEVQPLDELPLPFRLERGQSGVA